MKHRMDEPAGHPEAEFTVRLMAENTKRLSSLLLIVILAQLVFILLEISGAMAWVWTVFLSRLAVIAACWSAVSQAAAPPAAAISQASPRTAS